MEDDIALLSLRDDEDEARPVVLKGSHSGSGFEFSLVGCFLTTSVSSAFAAEALALLRALEFTKDLGLSWVLFEGDYLHVIHKLNITQADRSEIRALVTEERLRLITFFAAATVYHCFREQNWVAHQLMTLRFRWTLDSFWVEEVPFQVESAMAADGGQTLICLNFAAYLGLELSHLSTCPCCVFFSLHCCACKLIGFGFGIFGFHQLLMVQPFVFLFLLSSIFSLLFYFLFVLRHNAVCCFCFGLGPCPCRSIFL
ncbi:hypothetical protein PVK06_048800 [Gossypium arboreum]|uniref:RNase H type-1 domain-containing protein n=1 Tax=Gossypium arboreum TaxID=29729 RepID=A0ABR0MH88_GOSAR|nr:hypothetical protein PVK06_048800 [Gossypium arboreum]